MITDLKAEELEARGLYRRAAARWTEVMLQVNGDREREWIAKRRGDCIQKSLRPPVRPDSYRDVRDAARQTQKSMGLDRPDGEAFRNYPKSEV
ncbi:TPA: PerC family transcriptional regulator [Salmonella enterica]|uniref:PerC family transcriptional regulator n=1 Tax=Salmonella enterica TaxID=28901 RepID=A0A747SUE0_SALER|nr:PerC family transcriptional regulator [Salmonella enterica]HAF4697568.1 PerC family transcriptional regulator [Salmonella enterica]